MKINWIEFALSSLAVFRVSLLISKERGPADAAKKLRTAPKPHTNLRYGLSCPWCTSIYVSLLMTSLLTYLDKIDAWWFVPTWLALSGASIVINQQWTRDDKSK